MYWHLNGSDIAYASSSDWLAPCQDDSKRAWCKYCKCSLNARVNDLKDHAGTEKHDKSVKAAKNPVPSSSMTLFTKPPVSDEQKVAELKVAAFIASSGIAFRQVDNFVSLLKSIIKKDIIVKDMKVRLLVSSSGLSDNSYLLARPNEMYEIGNASPWARISKDLIGRSWRRQILIDYR